ncbi:pirin family protein [Calothrix sp. 336/3]|uniref:pirin family protein n=1 Tax=Calothrix sp. 336/3 TaxID=1337936 RepID=UPI0004E3FA22|nr:pirin family protein [Calothrix sp. 336/3]AKG23236.1 quercetin 2,3-dioxygenase [Calothrix sp. 336/3]
MTNQTANYLIHDRNSRGHTKIGWLDSYHTFSFGNFQDPNRMGFRSLRVINDDRVIPGAGFATHGHKDMEIFTYVLEGELEHKDSLGNGAIIRPGEAQIMSAGTGILHSEFNPSSTEPVHLLQIWILPNQKDLAPRYDQKAFSIAERQGKLRLIAAHDGRDGAVKIFQDVDLYTGILQPGDEINYEISSQRYGWLQIAKGVAVLNGEELREGDGVQITGAENLHITTEVGTEILLFDLG